MRIFKYLRDEKVSNKTIGSSLTLILVDQVITHSSDSSTKNARETKKERRKVELYSIVSRYREMPINVWMEFAVSYYMTPTVGAGVAS